MKNSFTVSQSHWSFCNYFFLKDDGGESAEVKIAKVAITNVLIWVSAWTPYAVIAMTGCFGNAAIVS